MIRILLADDQKSIREILRLRLEAEPDFEVVGTACDGETAIEMAEIQRPDIVLIDLEMPGLDGVKATELICQALPEIKVLVLSAHNDDQYITRALSSGAMGYLLKSTPEEELREAIRCVHRGYSQLGPGILNKIVSAESSSLTVLKPKRPANAIAQSSIDAEPLRINLPLPTQSNELGERQPDDGLMGWGVSLWRILRRRWVSTLAVSGTTIAAMAVYTFFVEEPIYQSELWIQVNNKSSVPVVNENQEDSEINEDPSKGRLTEVQILRSSPLISKAITQLPEQYRNELSIRDLEGNLSVSQAEEGGLLSNVLIVDYSDTDPQRVYAVLQALGKAYVSYSAETMKSRAASTIQFIEAKLPTTRQSLNQANEAVTQFRQRFGIVTPESYGEELQKNKVTLANDIQKANVALNQAKSRVEANRHRLQSLGQDPVQSATAAVLGQDSDYQKLSNQLKDIEVQLIQKKSDLSPDHPLVRGLLEQRAEILSLRQKIAQNLVGNDQSSSTTGTSTLKDANTNEILNQLSKELLANQTELEVQQTQLRSLRQAQVLADERFKKLPQLQETFTELQRQVTLHSTQLDSLLKQLLELKVVAAQETTPWRILQPPEMPTNPVSPDIKRNLLFGFLFSGVLGLGTALILDRLDRRVKNVKEAQEITKLQLLGTIPYCQGMEIASAANNMSPRQNNHSKFKAAFRSLALQIQYLNADYGVKTLNITSAESGEGKSTVALELSQALAHLGLKVLLVDADMRHPNLHALTGLSNTNGLKTAIESDQSWTVYLQTTQLEGLSILTAGAQPQESLALLQSKKMHFLLEDWRSCFDFVIVDTSPIGESTDTQGLVSKMDCTVLVVGIDRTTRTTVTQAIELLRSHRNELARLVVNLDNISASTPEASPLLPLLVQYEPELEKSVTDLKAQKKSMQQLSFGKHDFEKI